jgi:predicted DNA-binding ribbon-helix-helix protein
MSKVVKRSIVIAGHKTSVSLEDDFWSSLRQIAKSRGMHVQKLASEIDSKRTHGNLSCAIRLYVLDHYQTLAQNVPP